MVSEHVLSALAPKSKSRQANDALQKTTVGREQRSYQIEMRICEEFLRKSPHIDAGVGFVLNHLVADCSSAWSGLNQTSKARGHIASLMIIWLKVQSLTSSLLQKFQTSLFSYACLFMLFKELIYKHAFIIILSFAFKYRLQMYFCSLTSSPNLKCFLILRLTAESIRALSVPRPHISN